MSTSGPERPRGAGHDLIVIGAGIIGLAHAAEARRRGRRVLVLEQDDRAIGASVRNFGHVCTTAQPAVHQRLAQASREGWLRAAERYGVPAARCGTLVLGDRPEAEAVLAELAEARPEDVRLLGRAEITAMSGGLATASVTTGAHLVRDLRTDPRRAVARLAEALAADGAEIAWGHHVVGLEEDGDGVTVRTSRGAFRAEHAVLCAGHDLDRLLPEPAERQEVRRCSLDMMRLAPLGARIEPALLTTTSMLRYGAFAETAAFPALARSVAATGPELLEVLANVMATQLPDGSLILGDSHCYGLSVSPFQSAAVAELLLAEASRLLAIGAVPVIERWQGVYADSPLTDLVEVAPSPRIRAITVTSGIGMTLSFGLAARTLDAL